MANTELRVHKHNHHYLKKPDLSKMWVVAVVSNPVRYISRYKLFEQFRHEMETMGANLFVCEIAFGNRNFEIIEPGEKNTLGLRTFDELWHKEQMINLAVQRLPPDWEQVCWIDADISCLRVDGHHQTGWLEETWHQLQHHHVVQMFSHAIDLGPNNQLIGTHNGFMYLHVHGKLSKGACPDPYEQKKGKEFGHPGYAWACDRFAWDHGFYHGLVDYSILGAGDHHMARGLLGEIDFSIPSTVTCPYLHKLKLWEEHAVRYIQKDVGYVPATIVHHWHGKKRERGYVDRWKILVNNKFDPDLDLKKDWQGLYHLSDRNINLRDDIRRYFRSRNEDSIDLE